MNNYIYWAIAMTLAVAIFISTWIPDSNKRRAAVAFFLLFLLGGTQIWHKLSLGLALPGGELRHGQTYEVHHHFTVEGTDVVYLAPVNVHISDGTYSRISGEVPRFYTIGGKVPTNKVDIAFSDNGQGWLRALDGTNSFRLVAE